jgi:alpha-tubulin suppressor-like RCC1 family protein
VPATATNVIAIAAGHYHNLALKADGTIVAWGRSSNGEYKFASLVTNAIAISAGPFESLAELDDGSVLSLSVSRNYFTSLRNPLSLSAGWPQDLALTADGRVFSRGTKNPVVPASATNIVAIAAGTNYNLALDANGRVLAWGSGSTTNVPASLTNVTAIAAGSFHGLAVIGDGAAPSILGPVAFRQRVSFGNALPLFVRTAGSHPLHYQWLADLVPIPGTDSPFPQIPAGLGTDNVSYQVVVSSALGSVTSAVATVRVQSVALWGDNRRGQCALPAGLTNPCSLAAGAFHCLALNADGTGAGWGKDVDGQCDIPASATNLVALAAGGDHSLGLRDDGSVVGWGRNGDGQINIPSAATNVVAISAGWAHSLALRADGNVLAWGNDDYGQTDVSFLATGVIAISAGYYHNMALRTDRTVATWGWDVPVPVSATNIVAIAAGWEHCLALRADGVVVAWGDNTYGQSTVPASATNIVTIAAGFYHNIALRADGAVIVWGKSALGVAQVPTGFANLTMVAAGEDYSLAVGASGPPSFSRQIASAFAHVGGEALLTANVQGVFPMTFQWFRDGVAVSGATNGSLVLTNSQAANAGTYVLVVSNVLGQTTSAPVSLVIQADPVTFTIAGGWGDNFNSQCTISHAASAPRAIAAGAFHGLALNADGTVAAWGKNRDGQASVPLTATNAVAVAAGGDHSLALRADGSVLAWGRNGDGQTNVPAMATNIVAIAAGWAHSLALRADGKVVSWGNDDYGQTEVSLLPADVISIAAGYYHSLVLRSDHTVLAVGFQNDVPATATNVVAIAGGWWHSLALRADGTVVAWGDNSFSQCSVPASATNVVAISAGYYHNLALRADGTVVAWGRGYHGVTNVPAGLGHVTSIAAGEDYSLALVELGPPRFTTQPSQVTAHVGGRSVFSASYGGTHPLTVQWFHDGTPIDGATNFGFALADIRFGDAGNYTLAVVNGVGQSNNQTTVLTVLSEPVVAAMFGPRIAPMNSSFCLAPAIGGVEPLAFRWQFNGMDLVDSARIGGATSRTLCITGARTTDSGTYTLMASNADGVVTGIVAQVSVPSVLAWGDNTAGQLFTPDSVTNMFALAAGGDHCLGLRDSGAVVAWGDNSYGQNNVPQAAASAIAISDGESHCLALRPDGTVSAWGDNTYGQTNVPATVQNVIAVAAGGFHSLALRRDGSVVAWGNPSQLATSSSLTNVVAIAAGRFFSVALRGDGTVVSWGGGPVNTPALATNLIAIAAGATHILGLRTDGRVVAWGGNFYDQSTVPAFVTNAVGIAAGGDLSMALLADGTLVAWGANYSGQAVVPAGAANSLSFSAGTADALCVQDPAASTRPVARAVTIGQSIALISPTFGGLATYQWQLNGINLQGATNASLVFSRVDWTNAGTYRLVVSNSLGVVAGPPSILTVLRTPLVFDTSTFVAQPASNVFHLRLLGASGLGPVVLYASTDLTHWNQIWSSPATVGSLDFTSPLFMFGGQRFFRAAEAVAAGPIRISLETSSRQAGTGNSPLRVSGLTALGPVTIFASSNLVNWEPIFTNPPTKGLLRYLDASATAPQARFYRASEAR